MEDSHIVALYWDRDETAITASQQKYGGFCERIALQILGRREDSEECVADTWLRTWNTVPPARPVSLRAFFGRIVRNLSLSRYRQQRAQKRYAPMELLLEELEDCIPAPQNTETAAETAELVRIVDEWLGSLPQQERILFLRRYWFGDALSALAKECGISPNALAQKMLRMRLRLKALLEKEGYSI